eukprot:1184315-Prorocentrum_minimum.AAC.2
MTSTGTSMYCSRVEPDEHVGGEDTACGTTGRTGKLGMCQCCGEQVAKYRCPGCEVATCSLACSRAHKAETKCTGKRNRTEFVPTNQLTDRHLQSGMQDLYVSPDEGGCRCVSISDNVITFGRHLDASARSRCDFLDGLVATRDYRFLEEVISTSDSTKRLKPASDVSSGKGSNLHMLKSQAQHRNVELMVQPQGMERRRKNTTYYCKKCVSPLEGFR